MVTQQQADSIREGLLQDAEERDIAHDYRTLTAGVFLAKYTQYDAGFRAFFIPESLVERIDNGLDSLAITPK